MKLLSQRNRFFILIFIVIALIGLYYQGMFNFFTFEYFKEHLVAVQQHIQDNYVLSVLIFIVALTCAVALSVPLGVLTPLTSGLLFGWIPGSLYGIMGATCGATIAFLTSRYFVGEYVQHKFVDRLKAFNHELERYGYIYLLGLHFFPITPFFILNLLAGLTRLSLWTFVWTTVVGIAPSFFIYTFIGNQITEINQFTDLLSGKVFIAFILLKILSLTTIAIGRFGPLIKKYIKG